MSRQTAAYLLADQISELDRLQLQSRVWEPAARSLLAEFPGGPGATAVDVGCGVMGWIRALSDWVGPSGRVVATDIDSMMLRGATTLIEKEDLGNVTVVQDDLFDSRLQPGSFDLVHSRFQIAPLGRAQDQVAAYLRLLRPGGALVIEDPDMASWRVNPDAPAVHELIALIERGFLAAGGNFNAGRDNPSRLRAAGLEPRVRAQVLALEPGHPYLRLPLQFAASLRPRLEALTSTAQLDSLIERAEGELSRPCSWGTTFTLVQAYAFAPKAAGDA